MNCPECNSDRIEPISKLEGGQKAMAAWAGATHHCKSCGLSFNPKDDLELSVSDIPVKPFRG